MEKAEVFAAASGSRSHPTALGPYFLHKNQYFPMSSKRIQLSPKRHSLNLLHRVMQLLQSCCRPLIQMLNFLYHNQEQKEIPDLPLSGRWLLGNSPPATTRALLQPMLSWICLFKCYTFSQFTQIPMKQLRFFPISTKEKITVGVTPAASLLSLSSSPGQVESLYPQGICPSLCLWYR